MTPWTAARQAPLSMGFYRQEFWSGLPCLSPGDLSYSGIEPRDPALQADSLPSEPPAKPSGQKIPARWLALGDWLWHYRALLEWASLCNSGVWKLVSEDQEALRNQ